MATMTASARAQVVTVSAAPAEPQFPDIQTLRNAIPQHCFDSSVVKSMSYLVRDLIMAGSLGWAAVTFIPTIPDGNLRALAWIIYGFVQGLICTGIWILGHECGHGAFSKHQKFNDVIGWFSHSLLMVPYFSWKYSHHRHHRFTGHMEKDMAFVPKTREDYMKKAIPALEFLEDTPAYQIVQLFFHQVFGWFSYLALNVSAGSKSLQKKPAHFLNLSHFDPTSAVFRPNEAPFIALSDVGLATTLFALYQLSFVVGTQNVLLLYAQAWFWVHHWLVAITYLHHNHVEVPHYEADSWTFVKGALATVDREFGFVGRHLFHGIIEYHVVHHLFPRIPFYYAEEATFALKPVLGDLYRRDDRSFLGQLWSVWTTCKFVDKDETRPGTLTWVRQ